MSTKPPKQRLACRLLLNHLNLWVPFAAAYRIADLAFFVRLNKRENSLWSTSHARSSIDIEFYARPCDLDSRCCVSWFGVLRYERDSWIAILAFKALCEKRIEIFVLGCCGWLR